jgi:hypothetical protein
VSSTNLASVGAAALETLHAAVYATARRIEQHLRPLFDGLRRLLLPSHLRPQLGAPGEHGPPAAPTVPPPATTSTVLPDGGSTLPRAYDLNRVVLLARDPWSLFAHWEISPVERVEALRELGGEGEGVREVVRVHGPDGDGLPSWDLEIEPGAQRLHFRVERPGRAYRVEVGLRTQSGRFVSLVSSNTVTTPAAAPSPDLGVRWVALGGEAAATEVAGTWSGQRVASELPATAGRRDPAPSGAEAPSSDSLPRTSRASDALPLR